MAVKLQQLKPAPAAVKPPVKPAAAPKREALPPPVIADADREVLYPEYYVELRVVPERKVLKGVARKAPLTPADAKVLLGWEDEAAYSKRISAETGRPEDKCQFPGDIEVPPFEDTTGANVVCWNNHHNRPFDREHALKLAQDILNNCWRFNMENAIISKYGTVLSAQHRLVALVFADQLWNGDQKLKWRSICKTAPAIECSIAFGCEESPDLLMTLDNVKPRSESDVIYTSAIFADLNHGERKECSRMQGKAIDLLWKRSGAGGGMDTEHKYQTHSTSLDFLDRHKRLVEAVRHLFECNKGRGVSVLKLSPGECSAMLYMMASGKTDGDAYWNSADPPSEKTMSFELWDEATEFWTTLSKHKEDDNPLRPLATALALLVDPDEGLGGRLVEKLALVALAWRCWLDNGKAISEDNVFVKVPDGAGGTSLRPNIRYSEDRKRLIEPADFAGIDRGYKAVKEPEDDPAEVEHRKQEERPQREAEQLAKVEAAKKKPSVAVPPPRPNGKPTLPPAAQVEADRRLATATAEVKAIREELSKPSPIPPVKPPLRRPIVRK